jgi:hypothetical protein
MLGHLLWFFLRSFVRAQLTQNKRKIENRLQTIIFFFIKKRTLNQHRRLEKDHNRCSKVITSLLVQGAKYNY